MQYNYNKIADWHIKVTNDSDYCDNNYICHLLPANGAGVPLVNFYDRWAWLWD